METRFVGKVYGCTFGLVIPDELVELTLPRLPYGWEPAADEPELVWRVEPSTSPAHYDLYKGEELVECERPWAAMAIDVGGSIELWMAEHARGLIFVHAGAVAWKGRVIAVPGYTLMGKSMLIRELLRQGAAYLSDEYLPLRPDGLALPYARPISVRPNGDGLSQLVPLSEFGCEVVDEPLPLGLVADVRYDAEAGLVLQDLSRAQIVLALLKHCVPAQTRTIEALDHIGAAAQSAIGVTGTRGEATDAVPELLQRLS